MHCCTQHPDTCTDYKMKFLLLLVMLTACAAAPQDLSGKMFTFPQQTDSAHVKLETPREEFSAVTVCLRSFTDLNRAHGLFSLATPSAANDFLIYKKTAVNQFELSVRNSNVDVRGQEYKLNTWHSVCATWDSQSGLVQLWLDGKPSAKKFISSGSNIKGKPIIIIGQEQDSHGGRFDINQCFTGMISDVHMWDYALSSCEIQRYVDDLNFTPGNVLNWRALQFQITGRVLLENKQVNECH
ncbi:serum amyloid P-component-like [Centroberyx gerrardi]|uniref:serum amyloid P-component-like n=1 Tax=Centroberyx gerrardi TaxID=166262 RepID=UPI003AAF09F8